MARGGIYDQVGGGFARYAVDATWTVPHFEKMLYDNALLARAYLHGWQVSARSGCARCAARRSTGRLREMRGPERRLLLRARRGLRGVEGKFYVWTLEELRDVLGALYDDAVAYFGAPPSFEARRTCSRRAARSRRRWPRSAPSCSTRAPARVRPGLDDKRLTGWNALMISALADAGAVLANPNYLEAAATCASFLLASAATVTDGCSAPRRSAPSSTTTRYLIEALLTLYEATFDPR